MNAMTLAFVRLDGKTVTTPFDNVIFKHAEAARRAQEKSKGWSANLSYRTYTTLKAQGVME